MARIEKIEKIGGFLSVDQYEIKFSCGHTIKFDRQPRVHVGDEMRCPICG